MPKNHSALDLHPVPQLLLPGIARASTSAPNSAPSKHVGLCESGETWEEPGQELSGQQQPPLGSHCSTVRVYDQGRALPLTFSRRARMVLTSVHSDG